MTLLSTFAGALTLAGVLSWPAPWSDPRRVLWLERGASRRGCDTVPASASEVATVAQLMAIALRTGLPVSGALERVAGYCTAELRADLLPVVAAYERGAAPEDAWRAVPDLWSPITAALAVADRAGVAPGSLLLTASRAVLRRESVLRESAIGRVGVRLVLPLGAVLLPAFMCTTVVPLLIVMTTDFLRP